MQTPALSPMRTILVGARPLAFLLALLAGCGSEAPAPGESGTLPSPPRPAEVRRDTDVVILLVDTLRADFTSLDERKADRDPTPFLRELGDESVVFENAYSAGPWTLPSVASLVTGMHVAAHGVVDHDDKLMESVPTLAACLAANGYQTAARYKNPFAGPLAGLDRGYASSVHCPKQPNPGHVREWLSDVDAALPIFLYVHTTEPHDPQRLLRVSGPDAPKESIELCRWYDLQMKYFRALARQSYQDRWQGPPVDFAEEQQKFLDRLTARQAEIYSVYEVGANEADARLRSIVEAIKARGRWDQTLLIVVADHGDEFGEHGGWQHDHSLYEEMVHVPMVMRFPGGEFGGRRIKESSSLIDIAPTVIGYLGLTGPSLLGMDELDGRDWYTDLQNGNAEQVLTRVVATRVNTNKRLHVALKARGDRNLALRSGPWKAIWNHDLRTLELYNIEEDPLEQSNVAAEEPELTARLAERAEKRWLELRAVAASSAQAGAGLGGISAQELESLKTLGYVSDD